MSIETWKAEFYRTEPSDCKKEDAVQHSLTKWRGLTQENLDKHGLRKVGPHLTDSKYQFYINDATCSLCFYYLKNNRTVVDAKYNRCSGCPIYLATGCPCDEGELSPYKMWLLGNNPSPMINLLENILELQ